MLNKNELAEFKWTVKEYIKYGEENAIDQRWMKELENASAKHHIDKLTALKLECQAEYDKAFNTENQKVTDAVKEAYTDRYDHVGYEVQKGFNVGFKLNGISEEKLDKVIRKPWAPDGKNFSDRIWTKKEQMVEELYQALVRNTLGGSNLKDVINSMTKYVDKSTKNAKSAAARLVMTESAYFASQGQKDCFNDLGVEKYEIVATLDNKTSDICQGLDGKVFEMKEFEPGTTAPPFHVNCRSTTAPYFDDEFSLGERAARDAEGKTYYVPSDMTYKEWKTKQEEDIKKGATPSTNMGVNGAPKDSHNLQKQGVEPNKNSNTNTNDSPIKYNDITDKWIEKTKHGSYAECESITINEKTYKVGDNGVTLNLNNRTDEIEIAQALSEKYGKDVIILPEISGSNVNIKTADLMVNGKLVEIKTLSASGPNTIKNAIKRAKGQANDIIINIGETKLTTDEILDTIQKQFNNPQCKHMEHCIIMKDGEVVKVFEQKKVGTAAILKYDVVPTVDNITTKPIKSQLQNKEKNDKIYIRKAEVVDGKDLVGEVEYKGKLYRTNGDQPTDLFAIDEIVEKQGFNGLPTIINNEEELKRLTNADTLLGERTIRADNEKLFNQYCNDLLNDKFYINCATGGAQYGQGMYFAGDYTKGKIKAVRWQHEIDQYGGGASYQKTYWLTLHKDIKSIDINEVYPKYMEQVIKKVPMPEKVRRIFELDALKKPTREQMIEKMDLARDTSVVEEHNKIIKKYIDMDRGVMAAEMGYDMIEAKGHGTTGSYNVLLNRTKLIVIDKDIKAEEIEKVFGGK